MKAILKTLGLCAGLFSATGFSGIATINELEDGRSFDSEGPFDITQLTKGESVTLPSPATTLVPIKNFYRVGPTDRAQVFRLSSPATACAVKVQVFDKKADGIKTSTLRAGESMIYRFERLNGVRIHAEPLSKCDQVVKLTLDSNRPLEIGI